MVAFSSLFSFAALAPSALALQMGAPAAGTPCVAVRMQTGAGAGTLMPGDNSLDPGAGNFRRLSDALKEADIERRLEEEEIHKRENAAQLAREARERKIALLRDIPDATKAGTVDDFMFKEGVKDILA